MKWLTYLFTGSYDRPPPSRPPCGNVGGILLLMVGFQAVFALLCAIYTTICKRAVLSVVRRCSCSLMLYLYVSSDRLDLMILILIMLMYEIVAMHRRGNRLLERNKQTNAQYLQATLETTSNKYLELHCQQIKLCLDCEDHMERYFCLVVSSHPIDIDVGRAAERPLSEVKVYVVVVAGILLLSCILDFVFWLARSKQTTTRLVVYCIAMVRHYLQRGDEFKYVSIQSLEDVIETRCFGQQSWVFNKYRDQVIDCLVALVVFYMAANYVLPLCIRLTYWLDTLSYEIYILGTAFV